MTSRKAETRAQVERARQLYQDAEAHGEYLTLEAIGRALGISKQWASRLLMAAGLAPMPRPKGDPRAKGATISRQESGARGGRARTPAKLAAVAANLAAWRATASPEAVRANLAKARAAKPSAAEIAAMSDIELAERATLAMFQGRPHGVLRWIRHIEKRGLTLTDKQRTAKADAEKILARNT